MTQYYKWMQPGLVTATRRKTWPVDVGEWTPKETPVLCESGWHGVEEKDVLGHLPADLGAELWVVETRGRRLIGDDKFCAPQMRLVECIGVTDESNLRLFACDVAEDALSLVASPDPRLVKAIGVARRFAVGNATGAELSAARDAARDAAWDSVWDSVRDSAWYAAWYAAWALYSNWLVVRLESGY